MHLGDARSNEVNPSFLGRRRSDRDDHLQRLAALLREPERLCGILEREAVRDEVRGPHDAALDEREGALRLGRPARVAEAQRQGIEVRLGWSDRPGLPWLARRVEDDA